MQRSRNTKDLSWGRGILPYLSMVGRLHGDEPPFLWLSIRFGPYCMVQLDPINPLFLQKKSVCVLSHLVPEIRGHKVLRILHQLFSFCINWPPFSLDLDLIDPSFLQKFRSDWVHFFFVCCTYLPKIWWSTPHPRPFTQSYACTFTWQ